MSRITLDENGSAILPATLCKEMGLRPGDEIDVEARVIDGGRAWLLRRSEPDFSWIGSLKNHIKNHDHEPSDTDLIVEKAIAQESNA